MNSNEVFNSNDIKENTLEIKWNMELFNNQEVTLDNHNEGIDNKITKLTSKNAILDFTKNAFKIKKLAYGITNISKDADPNNKYLKGYIDIEEIYGLQGELDNIFYKCDLIREKQVPKEVIDEASKNGLYVYKGKFVDKETNTLYCRWFTIKPANNKETVFISIISMKGEENETGLVMPKGNYNSISINVSYFNLKKLVNIVIAEYNAFLTFSYFNKEVNFVYNK